MLAVVPDDRPLQHWLMVVGVGVVAGVLVAYQRGRIDALVASLDDAARTDPLTGLLNRRAFEELFENELERAHRSNGRLSVLLGDLDGFKGVNDRFGHEAGDGVLRQVAEDMLKWKRRMDTPARIGGEEFALLLPETDERGAFLVAERLRRATHRSFAEDPLGVTISFGVATYPEHGAGAARADARRRPRALRRQGPRQGPHGDLQPGGGARAGAGLGLAGRRPPAGAADVAWPRRSTCATPATPCTRARSAATPASPRWSSA